MQVSDLQNQHSAPVSAVGPDPSRLLLITVSALAVSLAVTAVKFAGWQLTESQAVYSDFLESLVNVVVGIVAIIVVRIAAKPADQNHPYGHGKIEYFSAAFEGGLIAFAAVMIFVEAIPAVIDPKPLEQMGLGAAVVFVCGLVNLVMGYLLKRAGRRLGSPAVVANGEHITSDFYTSAFLTVGLVLAHISGYSWLDPILAMFAGLQLAWIGFGVVKKSAGGSWWRPAAGKPGHRIVPRRPAPFHHIDAHAVVPEFWDVAEAHQKTEAFESRVLKEYPQPAELHLHVDPCRRVYCRRCDLSDCPIRQIAFETRLEPDLDTLTHPEEPEAFR